MARFEITILGCGSATPTLRHAASSQIVDMRDKLCMVDCGEGTQLQMRLRRIRFNRLNHIFISHAHGDHCLGLPGLLATLGLLGRQGELTVHAPKTVCDFLVPAMEIFCKDSPFPVRLNTVDPQQHALVMEDRSMRVYTIPLKHRIPTCGYLFEEKACEAHLIREMVDFYRIPVRQLAAIKQGADFVTEAGETVPNARLTRPADPPKRYAYCSDTMYAPEIVPLIEGADCLYHEATFLHEHLARARQTCHSTARQAAEIAAAANVKKLIIGHYSARYLTADALLAEAQSIFPQTIAADEGLTVALK